jgi:uncharacterized membrane protein
MVVIMVGMLMVMVIMMVMVMVVMMVMMVIIKSSFTINILVRKPSEQ